MQAVVPNSNTREVTNPREIETKAREFIKKRHFRVKQIFFKTIKRGGNAWFLEGDVSFGFIFTAARTFKLNINSENGEVTPYEETQLEI